jgi:glutamine synthetase
MNDHAARGMLTLSELSEAVRNGEIATVLTVFPDFYGRLMGKRITGHFFLDRVAEGGMHACDYLMTVDMEMDPVPGYRFSSWETGYGDFHCVPDLSTLRRVAWLPRTAMVFCDLFSDVDHQPIEVSPRRMLRRQVERAREMGFRAMAAAEIELYVFNETFESAHKKRYHDLETMGSYIEDYHILQGTKEDALIGGIRDALDASGVPVEFSKGEWGPGQQEINLEYSEVLTQCDRSVLYKHAAKEIAHAQGKALTFMAKWDETLAGSSMHLHLSLWNESDGTSAFAADGAATDPFRWFLGGWMKRAKEFAACYAPYVSSYKRYQAGSFAPTAIAWSPDNRTAGFRVVGQGPALRIECRIPGADANPYVAFAASLAAGLDGIENRIEPPPAFSGDLYAAKDLPRVPSALRDAIVEFEGSDFARDAFGEDVAEHYLHFLKTEQRKFDEVVTCWERARYFERA